MKRIMVKWLNILFILFTLPAFGAIPTWKIIPSESSITFTGTQNDAPASGDFKKFSGEISFDPNQLNDSKVHMVVDMNSLTTTYTDFTATLLTPDWFSVELFPTATLDATNFKKIATDQYQAEGKITIKNKTIPVLLTFTGKELSPTKGQVKGTMTLSRTAFNIGEGEWGDIDIVKDKVVVNFTITAEQ